VILDSSAVVAILLRESGYEQFVDAIAADPAPGMGTATLAETGIVLVAKLGATGRSLLARFVDEAAIAPIPLDAQHWGAAVDAYQRFGRGRHRARLNFGDCLTYSVAKLADEPLLFVGGDFGHTDLTPAL
jgi:ribonuclease VapC